MDLLDWLETVNLYAYTASTEPLQVLSTGRLLAAAIDG
jgi:hypothetical protein